MLNARKGLDAHEAYNQFRSFAEIVDMLDLDPRLNAVVIAGDGGGGDGSDESAVGMNANAVQLYRQLRAERAAHAAALAEEQAAHAAALAEAQAAHAAQATALAEERAANVAAQADIAQLRALLSEQNIVNL